MFLSTVSKFLSADGTLKAVVWRSAGDHPFLVTLEGRGFSATVSHDELIAAEREALTFIGEEEHSETDIAGAVEVVEDNE